MTALVHSDLRPLWDDAECKPHFLYTSRIACSRESQAQYSRTSPDSSFLGFGCIEYGAPRKVYRKRDSGINPWYSERPDTPHFLVKRWFTHSWTIALDVRFESQTVRGFKNLQILAGRWISSLILPFANSTLSVKGYDVAHIHHMLGNRTLETTQMLLTTDPVSMGAIAARAFWYVSFFY